MKQKQLIIDKETTQKLVSFLKWINACPSNFPNEIYDSLEEHISQIYPSENVWVSYFDEELNAIVWMDEEGIDYLHQL